MSRIRDIIVLGKISDRDKILTDKFHQKCTDEELSELFSILYSWTTLSLYSKEYKAKLKIAMKNIAKIQKERLDAEIRAIKQKSKKTTKKKKQI